MRKRNQLKLGAQTDPGTLRRDFLSHAGSTSCPRKAGALELRPIILDFPLFLPVCRAVGLLSYLICESISCFYGNCDTVMSLVKPLVINYWSTFDWSRKTGTQ